MLLLSISINMKNSFFSLFLQRHNCLGSCNSPRDEAQIKIMILRAKRMLNLIDLKKSFFLKQKKVHFDKSLG